jgi:hypothetical protein
VAALNACLAAAVLAAPVDAATMATARIGSAYGEARILVGTSTRLGITARSLVPGTVYTVALRSGSCSTMGMLILSRRLTASRYGKINATLVLTASQARLVVLPMSIRVGKHCGSFRAAIQPGSFVDGTWRVGADIQPGTYRTAGGSACHWGRLYGLGGTPGEVIADNYYTSGPWARGPQVVTIAPTDAGFASNGCGTWRLQSEPAVGIPTEAPGDGTWRVGVDIQPGTYRAPGGPPATPPYNWDSWAKLCRWSRISGFGGTRGETIAGIASPGSLAGGPQVVTIVSTDAGFRSSGCGTWTLAP